ncbi:MAG: hypothetical protein ACK55I_26790, partial [bacterium]
SCRGGVRERENGRKRDRGAASRRFGIETDASPLPGQAEHPEADALFNRRIGGKMAAGSAASKTRRTPARVAI